MSGMADVQLEVYYNIVVQGLGLAMPGVQIPLRRKTGELVDSSVVIKKTRAPGAPCGVSGCGCGVEGDLLSWMAYTYNIMVKRK